MILVGTQDRAAAELARGGSQRVVVVETLVEVELVAVGEAHRAIVLDVRIGGTGRRSVDAVPGLLGLGAPVLLYSPSPDDGERSEARRRGAAGVLAAEDLPQLGAIVAALRAAQAVRVGRASRRRAS